VLGQQILAHALDFSRLTDFPSQYTINLVEVRHERKVQFLARTGQLWQTRLL